MPEAPKSDQIDTDPSIPPTHIQPGHEYTKSNVKFCISVLQSEAVKKLQAFANENKETQGKFTIGDEKVTPRHSPDP